MKISDTPDDENSSADNVEIYISEDNEMVKPMISVMALLILPNRIYSLGIKQIFTRIKIYPTTERG